MSEAGTSVFKRYGRRRVIKVGRQSLDVRSIARSSLVQAEEDIMGYYSFLPWFADPQVKQCEGKLPRRLWSARTLEITTMRAMEANCSCTILFSSNAEEHMCSVV